MDRLTPRDIRGLIADCQAGRLDDAEAGARPAFPPSRGRRFAGHSRYCAGRTRAIRSRPPPSARTAARCRRHRHVQQYRHRSARPGSLREGDRQPSNRSRSCARLHQRAPQSRPRCRKSAVATRGRRAIAAPCNSIPERRRITIWATRCAVRDRSTRSSTVIDAPSNSRRITSLRRTIRALRSSCRAGTKRRSQAIGRPGRSNRPIPQPPTICATPCVDSGGSMRRMRAFATPWPPRPTTPKLISTSMHSCSTPPTCDRRSRPRSGTNPTISTSNCTRRAARIFGATRIEPMTISRRPHAGPTKPKSASTRGATLSRGGRDGHAFSAASFDGLRLSLKAARDTDLAGRHGHRIFLWHRPRPAAVAVGEASAADDLLADDIRYQFVETRIRQSLAGVPSGIVSL